MMTEEERAALYRSQQAQMVRQRATIERGLAGNAAARAALDDDYEPIVQWLAERNSTDGGEKGSRILAN